MPSPLRVTALAASVLLFASVARGAERAGMEIERAAVAVGKAGARVQLRGRCPLPAPTVPAAVTLDFAGHAFDGALDALGSTGRGVVRLRSADDGIAGRLLLQRVPRDAALDFRLTLRFPGTPPGAVPIELRIGDAICARSFVFQQRAKGRGGSRFPWTGRLDRDGDGSDEADCAPGDPGVHPGAVDVCENGIDEDCDGGDAVCDAPRFPGLIVASADQPIAGDLNLDGTSDIAFGFWDEIFVRYGRGDGTFVNGPIIRGALPIPRRIADVDGDGWPDIVITHPDGGDLRVVYGDAAGGFTDDTRIPTGPGAFEVTTADLDADGQVDLITSVTSAADAWVVAVVRGLGGRTFAPPVTVRTIGYGVNIAVGDVNDDRAPDVAVVTNVGGVQILLNDGHGRLEPQQALFAPPPGNSGMHGIVLGRFDAGETLDLALSGFREVVTLYGNGDGTFVEGPRYAAGGFSAALASADLDADGVPDLAVGGYGGGGLMRGDGAGGFIVEPPVGPSGAGAQIGAFTQNGSTDVLLGGAIFPARNVPSKQAGVDHYVRTFAVADLNADGDPDYVLVGGTEVTDAGANDAKVTVFFGGPDGQPTAGETLVVPPRSRFDTEFQQVVLADFDGDRQPDAAVSRFFEGGARLFRGLPGGTFTPAGSVSIGRPDALAATDVDGDGAVDLIGADATRNELSVARGDGAGTFAAPTTWPACRDVAPSSAFQSDVVAADVDGDGIADLVVACFESAEVAVLRGLGGATFAPQALHATGGDSHGVAAGDFDADGKPDLAVALSDGGIAILRNLGDGTFEHPHYLPIGSGVSAVLTGDVDGDGRLDVVGSSPYERTVWLAHGDGNGFFSPVEGFTLETGTGLALVDANRDGALDIATGALRILLQTR